MQIQNSLLQLCHRNWLYEWANEHTWLCVRLCASVDIDIIVPSNMVLNGIQANYRHGCRFYNEIQKISWFIHIRISITITIDAVSLVTGRCCSMLFTWKCCAHFSSLTVWSLLFLNHGAFMLNICSLICIHLYL